MRLFLIQHGKTVPQAVDPDQPLSEQGRIDARAAAVFFRERQIFVAELWHSTKTRAVQTAQIIAEGLDNVTVLQREDLNPLDPVQPVAEELAHKKHDMVIVGHLPFLEKLAALLICGEQHRPCGIFYHAGIVCLDRVEDAWNFSWFLTPAMLEQHDVVEDVNKLSDERFTAESE